MVLILVAQWASEQYGGWAFDRSAYQAGAWWQLLTSQWVHFNTMHAAANLLAMGLIWWSLCLYLTPQLLCVAWAGGYLGVACVLALDPQCTYYAGASGALHGLLAGSAIALCVKSDGDHPAKGMQRYLGYAVLLGLLIKLVVQHQLSKTGTIGWLGVPTYFPAHEMGAVGGLLFAALYVFARYRIFARPHNSGS